MNLPPALLGGLKSSISFTSLQNLLISNLLLSFPVTLRKTAPAYFQGEVFKPPLPALQSPGILTPPASPLLFYNLNTAALLALFSLLQKITSRLHHPVARSLPRAL